MNDLTRYPYEFVMENRMGYVWKDEEYRVCALAAEEQKDRVRSCLNEEQQKELDLLLDRFAERDRVEKTRQFQATLNFVHELSALIQG